MPRVRLDFLVIETFERLSAASAFLDIVDQAIPKIEWEEREAFRRLAEDDQWEIGDRYVNGQILDEKFRRWAPRLAAYSVVILLYSVVETQLVAFAERAGEVRGSTLRLKDMRGRGIEQAALYLKRVGGLNVKQDPAWKLLIDLRTLRNIIVHTGGQPGESPGDQDAIQRLAREGRLSLPENPVHKEVCISMHQCSDILQEAEGFFRRIFRAEGLPNKGVRIEKELDLSGDL